MKTSYPIPCSFLCWHSLWSTSFWPPSMVYISIINYTLQFLQVLTCFMVTFCGSLHLHLSFWLVGTTRLYSLQTCSCNMILELSSTSCIEPRFYATPFKFKFNQLLILIEKLLPLPGFQPRTSPIPRRYATKWAILAWIPYCVLCNSD